MPPKRSKSPKSPKSPKNKDGAKDGGKKGGDVGVVLTPFCEKVQKNI